MILTNPLVRAAMQHLPGAAGTHSVFVLPEEEVTLLQDDLIVRPVVKGEERPCFSVSEMINSTGDVSRAMGVADVNDLSFAYRGQTTVPVMNDPRLGFFERAEFVSSAADRSAEQNGTYYPGKAIEAENEAENAQETASSPQTSAAPSSNADGSAS